jgi:sugar/nucleoside kinase (ribokinase family)
LYTEINLEHRTKRLTREPLSASHWPLMGEGMRAACFSVAAMDFFPQQNAYYAGGNSLNQAVRFRQMGYPSAFLGALGTDEAGDRITALLRSAGVDISRMQRLEGFTARNRIINDAAGERYGIDGAWESGVYEAFRMAEADWDFLQTYDVWATHANSPCYPSVLERKSGGKLLSVDFLHLRDYALLEKSLSIADIVYSGGTEDMLDDLARMACKQDRLIVLTLGARGSIAFAGSRTYRQAALPTEKVIDTTGCGDAFQAGFTASYYRDKDIPAALLAGAEWGRKAAMSYGGVSWG